MEARPNYLMPGNLNSPNGRVFWEGLRDGRLMAPKCRACGEEFFPPRPICPECLGDALDWRQLSGRGTLASWTEMYFARPEFDTPFFLGLIDLEEGIGRILARIEGVVEKDLVIGDDYEIYSADTGGGFFLYFARPRTRSRK
ncbi:MAG: Zn-ribbon domain-containing OB-fold protein [Firmicutes bacterium]|nr:Zn-ribbon domain-containing OB-fold protein [Bacillota bacterium]